MTRSEYRAERLDGALATLVTHLAHNTPVTAELALRTWAAEIMARGGSEAIAEENLLAAEELAQGWNGSTVAQQRAQAAAMIAECDALDALRAKQQPESVVIPEPLVFVARGIPTNTRNEMVS